MPKLFTRYFPPFFILVAAGLTGCGTLRMMPSVGRSHAPKIYSGTRLDLHTVRKDTASLRKFQARPPEYPLIDLPFSMILDTLILPVTFPIATYEILFGGLGEAGP